MPRPKGVPAQKSAARLDADGVPVDPNEWTTEDWRDLWLGIQAIKAKIAERHRGTTPPTTTE